MTSELRPDFRLTPRPPLRKSERGSVAVVALALVAATSACRPAVPQATTITRTDSARSSVADSGSVQAPAPFVVTSAAQRFVAEFYAWYVPASAERHSSFWVALRERGHLFADTLRNALSIDTVAQTAAVGEIDGIDWDPYLSSQDPCDRYDVGEAVAADGEHLVPVFAVCGGAREAAPSVRARVDSTSHGWVFKDFEYPGDSLSLLAHIRILHPEQFTQHGRRAGSGNK